LEEDIVLNLGFSCGISTFSSSQVEFFKERKFNCPGFDDENKVPVRIKASLCVGSIKADLDEYKRLKHTLKSKNNGENRSRELKKEIQLLDESQK
jgi:hypothetical protein